MFPYGACPSSTIRCAPITPARPTSITLDARRFMPKRKPARKTVAASRTQTGQSGAALGPAALPADPRHAAQQVEERRVGERHRREDLALVEEVERDPEREQDEQVEVPDRERLAQVGEAEEEDEAEPAPDPRVVDLAAEGAVVAAGHLPRHLRARPRLRHRARRVVHLGEHDLARVREVGPDLDGPDLGRPRRRWPRPSGRRPDSGRASRRPCRRRARGRSRPPP